MPRRLEQVLQDRQPSTGLEWVVCDGARTRVSAFAGLKPARRPRVTCPECGGELTLKLGQVRRHHAAHAPGSVCAAAHPETALHINAKCHLAAVLTAAIGSGKPLRVRRRCLVGNRTYDSATDIDWREVAADSCPECLDEEWIAGWDEVRIEFGVTGPAARRVPDVALLKMGTVIGAIEVLVSHAVDADKTLWLANLGVAWVEIRGNEALYRDDSAWSIETALELEASSLGVRWRCDRHEAARVAVVDSRMRVAEEDASRRKSSGTAVVSARLVDVYRPGGSSNRISYTITSLTNDGTLCRLSLERDGKVLSVHLAEAGESVGAFRSRASR